MKQISVIVCVLFTLCSLAWAADEMKASSVIVDGIGIVEVKPELIYINIGVESKGSNPAAILKSCDKIVAEIKKELTEKVALQPDNLQDARYNVNYTPQTKDQNAYYLGCKMLKIKVLTPEEVQPIIDICFNKGANVLESVDYTVANYGEVQEKAYRVAVLNAKNKIAAICEAAGIDSWDLVDVTQKDCGKDLPEREALLLTDGILVKAKAIVTARAEF